MAVDKHIQERLQDGYHTLMLEYAAGTLDQAQDLIVAAHLALSPLARNVVRSCEAMGGFLLEHECQPVAMKPQSLQSLMQKLDEPCHDDDACRAACKTAFAEEIELPGMLADVLQAQKKPPRWKPLYPGMKSVDLKMACRNSAARFLKIDPATKTPHHSHRGMEITLVLNGAFEDETGLYKRGDLIVTDETCEHTPVACPKNGCVCMIVTSAPIKLMGLAGLLNPFLRK
jgi:putative transcriptional regulator